MGSDDLTLFNYATGFTTGKHWFFKPLSNSGEFYPNHQSMRLSMFLFAAPFIALFGPASISYYAVPLLFAFLGFVMVSAMVSKTASFYTVVLIALLHTLSPFETTHSSVFLVDLPGAVFLLMCPCLIVVFSDRQEGKPHHPCLFGGLAGACGFFSYLFRENNLVFLGLSLGVLLLYSRYRSAAFWCGVWLGIGLAIEQLCYASLNLGFGFRWAVVSRALENYSRFLPTYPSLEEFVFRNFRFILRDFGYDFNGYVILSVYIAGLLLHPIALLTARSAIVRAVAMIGLSVWLVFSFGIYEWNDRHIRAMAPTMHRYYQPFYYSTLIVFGWGLHAGQQTLSRKLSEHSRWRKASQFILAGLTISLAIIFKNTSDAKLRNNTLNGPQSEVSSAVRALDRISDLPGREETKIYTTRRSNRVLKLFRNERSYPKAAWHYADLDDLIEKAKIGQNAFALDVKRLHMDVRYKDPAVAAEIEAQLLELETLLKDNYILLTPANKRHLVFAPLGTSYE